MASIWRLRKGIGLALTLASLVFGLVALVPAPATAADEPVKLKFVYGSEKKDWIKEVTAEFLKTNPTTKDGRPIQIEAVPLGSGETIHEVLEGKIKAHLISPASASYIELGNAEAADLKQPALVKKTRPLVLSPVVIAMWKPMAEALGWPGKPVGWDDLRKLTVAPDGWGSVGHPEWGAFKFGHTHPDYSNSGLIAVFSQVYAAVGKDNITVKDIADPRAALFLSQLQKAVVQYGSSTGFFADTMFKNEPEALNAAVLYESSVVESYNPKYKLKYPIVAIYPKEGTFWSDHPVGVVERPWVGAAEREAAELYIDFLLQEKQQRSALKYGFRPGLEKLEVGAPIDKSHGVDPAEPKILGRPSIEVMRAALDSWQKNKKSARILLVLDRSGSMDDPEEKTPGAAKKITMAKAAAKDIVGLLHDSDYLALMTFNHELEFVDHGSKVKGNREKFVKAIDGIKVEGMTSLYDAVETSHRHLQSWYDPEIITAVIILTDGEDEPPPGVRPPGVRPPVSHDKLMAYLKNNKLRNNIKFYTIAYGKEADVKFLKEVADVTQGKAYVATPTNIRSIVRDIVTFF